MCKVYISIILSYNKMSQNSITEQKNTKNSILLSIIIPIYNTEQYLEKCLDSIVNQYSDNIEIILVNDGSTDGSKNICSNYVNKIRNIKYLEQTNQGQSTARNNGIKTSRGQYIWFVDSDDWIKEGAIAKITKEITNNSLEMLSFSGVSFFEHSQNYGTPYQLMSISTTNGVEYIKTHKVFNPAPWNYIYNKNFLLSNNIFFKDDMILEDDYFNLICFSCLNKIKKIPETIYIYRRRENSTYTSEVTPKRLYSILELIKLCEKLKNSKLDKKFLERKTYNYISLLCTYIIKAKNKNIETQSTELNLKKIIAKQKLAPTDAIGVKIEKLIYNLSLPLYLKLKKIRSDA